MAHLVPFAGLPALAHPLVETGAWQRVGDGVAHIIEGQAAGEVDALDQRLRGLAEIADHEEAGRLDTGRDARLDGFSGLVGGDALLHLLEAALVAGFDTKEEAFAAGATNL